MLVLGTVKVIGFASDAHNLCGSRRVRTTPCGGRGSKALPPSRHGVGHCPLGVEYSPIWEVPSDREVTPLSGHLRANDIWGKVHRLFANDISAVLSGAKGSRIGVWHLLPAIQGYLAHKKLPPPRTLQ